MTIKPIVHENLATRQRILAAVAAKARGDEKEIQRLIDSSPDTGDVNAITITRRVFHPLKNCSECGADLITQRKAYDKGKVQ